MSEGQEETDDTDDTKRFKKRAPGAKPRVEHAAIEAALRKTGGNVSAAAKMLKLSQVTVSRRIRRSKELQELRDEITEEQLDLAETQLVKMIRERKHKGHPQAVLFLLRTKGRTRGYVERQELTGPPKGDETAQPVQVQVYLPAIDKE